LPELGLKEGDFLFFKVDIPKSVRDLACLGILAGDEMFLSLIKLVKRIGR
jgi:hypothetical protein